VAHPLPARLITVLALAAILMSPAAAQQNPAEEVQRVEQELETERARTRDLQEQARVLSLELEALRLRLVTAAQTTREREALIENLEIQIVELTAEAEARRRDLAERHRQLTGTLSALTGLAQDAPRAFFLYPGSPVEAVRGSMLLQSAAPALGRRAAVLREDLEALEAVRADLAARRTRLDQEGGALVEDRAELERLMARKKELYKETSEQAATATARLKELTERSETLRELLAALEQDRRAREAEEASTRAAREEAQTAPEADLAALAVRPTERPDGIRAFPEDGAIIAPVIGRLAQQYGQDTGFGQTARGIVVETRPSGAVVAPFDGRVVFAGPFRDLGRVLIIEHDGGYHTVLAGFERIDVADGHWLLAGEPVGTMPANAVEGTALTSGVETGSGTRPRLYMELRRGGQPVNPLRWITAGSIGING
jgi:septal ring factor EnvC (AmiA/AmiB activator)